MGRGSPESVRLERDKSTDNKLERKFFLKYTYVTDYYSLFEDSVMVAIAK